MPSLFFQKIGDFAMKAISALIDYCSYFTLIGHFRNL